MTTSSTKGQRVLFLDTETFSATDLRGAGLFRYMEDPAFEILLLPYAWDDDPVRVLDMFDPADRAVLPEILEGLKDPGVVKVAHNSAFERQAYRTAFDFYQPPEQWTDTMILCAMNGLPLSLEDAGAALGLPEQKMKEGKALIQYFCKPCKPTIANGGRTRNLPEHAPEKWAKFKQYAGRDVVTMRDIYRLLERYPITPFERRVWAVDARINERGVLVDTELAESAIAVDEAFSTEAETEMRRLTGLENPNSVAQLKEWLTAAGIEVESLNKATVKDLRGAARDKTIARVLELRQLLGKTSTTKYEAMTRSVCRDGRIRGILQYYGAGRTGRWAGRLLQVQNLPQNHLEPLEALREIVRARDLDALEMTYDSVPDVLSQLIRTALIAKPGHTFLVADYSAIEARVIAYLAGEQWRMDVFRDGGDIYCASASQMFHVPVVKHGENGHLRQKGKVAELACIAEGTLIQTDRRGLVPIEELTELDRVFDGEKYVRHDGVIYKGQKEVITYDELSATADHLVWVEGQSEPVPFGVAAKSHARLLRPGDCRSNLWKGPHHRRSEESRPGETEKLESHSRTVKVYDILNCGPNNRYLANGAQVHNCGYGGGINALIAFGADKMGLTTEEMQEIITSWREKSPMIVQLWRRVEDAARHAIENPGRRATVMRKYRDPARARQNEALTGRGGYSQDFLAGGEVCTYWRDKNALRCRLPSGRILTYWQPGIDDEGVHFMGQNQTTRRWEKTKTWGGRLVENIVQAYARDCLAVAMTRLDAEGWKICFHVHDEVIVEAPEGSKWEDVAEVMGRPIEWAPGLLLRGDGYETAFYKKD